MDLRHYLLERYIFDPYHMTHLSNLESILESGGIYSKNKVIEQKIPFYNISEKSVQSIRATKFIGATKMTIHDFVPLFWGRKTPMVISYQAHNENIIFLIFTANLMLENTCFLADGNAATNGTKIIPYVQTCDFNILDKKCINAHSWRKNGIEDEESKRKKQAELLVRDFLSLDYLMLITCYNDRVKRKIEILFSRYGVECDVKLGDRKYYFLK